MKTLVHRTGLFFILFSIVLGSPGPALAQKESCKKCEFRKCIKNTIKQKEALRAGYAALANKWDKIWVNADVNPPTPLDVIDLEKLDPPSRIPTLALLKTHFIILRNQEEDMANQIGPPQGCGYDPTKNYEMWTNTIMCSIDTRTSREAEEGAPCKELPEIAMRHEVLHLTRCQRRMGNKPFPSIIQTPAGKCREEMEAYAQEIAELKKLLEDMPGTYLEIQGRNVMSLPVIGTIVINLNGKIPFTLDEEAPYAINGSGSYSISADTSGSKCRISGYDQTYPLSLGGNKSGDTLNFKFIPTGTTVIPSFRITCAKGFGFSLPVPRMTGEVSLPAEDGQQSVTDITKLTQGHVQGQNTLTLHLCKDEK